MSQSTGGKSGRRQPTDTESGAVDEATGIEDEAVFDILKNSRRRATLEYLAQAGDETVPVSVLAEHVATAENETTAEGLSAEQRKRVYVSLHQCHLPKLDDLGVIRYDQEETAVELGPNAPDVMSYMRATSRGPRQWYRYYAAVVAVGALATILNLALSVVSPFAITALVLTAVALCAVADWRTH